MVREVGLTSPNKSMNTQKKGKKQCKKASFLFVFCIILLSGVVQALILTPEEVVLEEYSSVQEQVITIYNDQFEPVGCAPSVDYLSSYLLEHINFEPKEFIIPPNGQQNVRVSMNFPSDITPQTHKLIIVPYPSAQETATISFRPTGSSDSALEVKGISSDFNEEKVLVVTVELKNVGNTIVFATPSLVVEDYAQMQVKNTTYPKAVIIQPGEVYPLTLRQDNSELSNGEYTARVITAYDDNEESFFSEEYVVPFEVREKSVVKKKNTDSLKYVLIVIAVILGVLLFIWSAPHLHHKPKKEELIQVQKPQKPSESVEEERHPRIIVPPSNKER